MKKFKKFVASALAAVMVLGLAACGGGGGTQETQAGSGGTAETETTANEILTQETAAAANTSDGTAVDSGAATESAKDSLIMGYTADIIFSHGIILTKEEDYYGFYHVLITNDKIDITKELIAAEFAKKLFSISESNEESESLKDFFGITPTK